MTLVLAVLVGLGIGIVQGALGAGGGILAVPVLVYLLGQEPHVATASSLVIVGFTAALSIRHHARAGNVAWRDGVVFGLVSVVGAVAGSRLSALVPPTVLMLLLATMLAVVAVVMIRRAIRSSRAERAGRATSGTGDTPGSEVTDVVATPSASAPDATSAAPDGGSTRAGERRISWPALIATATLTGILTGFFGVGGGFIVVPMLVVALGLSMRRATGTSLLVMMISCAVSLISRIGTHVEIDWSLTLLFAAASAVGGMIGGPLSARARPSTLTWAFSVLLAAVAVVTFAERLLA